MKIVEFNNIDDDFNSNATQIRKCLDEPTIVLVFATWCPHCQVMKPAWEQLKNEISPKVNIIEIESVNLDRIRANNMKLYKKLFPKDDKVYFPTIKMWKDKKGKMYDSERDFNTMKTKMVKHFAKKTNKAKKATTKLNKTNAKPTQQGGSNNTLAQENQVIRKFKLDFNQYIQQLVGYFSQPKK